MHSIKIETAGGTAKTVELDGKPLKGLRRIEFSVDVDHVPQVTLVLYASAVSIEGELPEAGLKHLDLEEQIRRLEHELENSRELERLARSRNPPPFPGRR